MNYKIQGNYLTLIIDEQFTNKTVRELLDWLHLSKKLFIY